MEQDKKPTPMLFRVWRSGAKELFALLPEEPADNTGRNVTCYAHVGQHGAADLNYCISKSRPAKPEEYADLRRELEGFGYLVKPYCRHTRKMREAFRAEVRRLQNAS